MKKNIFFLIICAILTTAFNVTLAGGNPVLTGGPHDSLLFDGDNSNPGNYDGGYYPCFWKVVKLKGYAFGTVRKMHVDRICGVRDTSYTVEDDTLKEGDILSDGTIIETGPDGLIAVAVFLKSAPNSMGRLMMTSGPSSLMKIPLLNPICDALKTDKEIEEAGRVLIIKGKVTYDSPPSENIKMRTEGKRSSVKHSKTRYSHEVFIDAGDTIDIVRVYEGSVEISHIRNDFSDEESKAKEMEQLAQDFQAGKITMEEMAKKIEEYTANTRQISENLKPFTVDQGNKCILGKTSFKVETLGAGDEDVTK